MHFCDYDDGGRGGDDDDEEEDGKSGALLSGQRIFITSLTAGTCRGSASVVSARSCLSPFRARTAAIQSASVTCTSAKHVYQQTLAFESVMTLSSPLMCY